MKNPFNHYCEFCLVQLGAGAYKKPKLAVQAHKKMMHAHKPECNQWNDLAAKVMRL